MKKVHMRININGPSKFTRKSLLIIKNLTQKKNKKIQKRSLERVEEKKMIKKMIQKNKLKNQRKRA